MHACVFCCHPVSLSPALSLASLLLCLSTSMRLPLSLSRLPLFRLFPPSLHLSSLPSLVFPLPLTLSNQAQQKAHSGIVLSDEIDFFLRLQLLHWLVNHSVGFFFLKSTNLWGFFFLKWSVSLCEYSYLHVHLQSDPAKKGLEMVIRMEIRIGNKQVQGLFSNETFQKPERPTTIVSDSDFHFDKHFESHVLGNGLYVKSLVRHIFLRL